MGLRHKRNVYSLIPSINPSSSFGATSTHKIDPFLSLSSAPPTKKNSGMGVDGHRRNSWKTSPTWISLKGKFPSLLVEKVMSGSVTSWWPMSTSNTFCSSSCFSNISKFTHSIHGTGIFTYIYHKKSTKQKKNDWGKLYQSYESYMILWLGSTPHPVWRLSLVTIYPGGNLRLHPGWGVVDLTYINLYKPMA